MRLLRWFAFPWVVLAGACTGDEPPAGAPACTLALYDSCNSEHDCASNSCHNFIAEGFQVCTQGCDATNPCPNTADGLPVACDALGTCTPPAEHVCVVQP